MSSILVSIIMAILSKLFTWGVKQYQQQQADKAIDDKSKQEAQAVVDAKTPEQKDIADRNLLSGL